MDSKHKLHAVCIPCPVQGHITPMLKLAQLLHSKHGLHITFVNTHHNHRRLLNSRGGPHSHSLEGLQGFRFEAISDGLESSDDGASQDVPSLVGAIMSGFHRPFKELLVRLKDKDGEMPVSLIISDVIMPFAGDVGREIGIPVVYFWAASAHGFMGFLQYRTLLNKGIVPFKDSSFQTDGSLDMIIDWIPSMKGIPLKYMPTFLQTTNINDLNFNYMMLSVEKAAQSNSPIIFNTFDALECSVLEDISGTVIGQVYTTGPLHFQARSLKSNLWMEDSQCLDWLDSQDPESVVYVSFGSIARLTDEDLVELAWGLANSNHPFLWIVRPDLVTGVTAVIPPEFLAGTKNRGLMASWCDQEAVLKHESVGLFLTHCGWNSTIDALCGGVHMLCWPFFAEQQTNCWCCVEKWGIGMEIDGDVKREMVEKWVREMMEGDKGEEMRRKVMAWKRLAQEATMSPHGSSLLSFEKFVDQHLHPL